MTVKVLFECGGCDAKAEGTTFLRREFRSVSGRRHGIGGPVAANTIEDVTPEGWVAFDPYTYCCYCPTCWAEIAQDGDGDSPPSVSQIAPDDAESAVLPKHRPTPTE